MKKYIVSALVAFVFMVGAPFLVQKASASDISVRDLIILLIDIGVITPDKMPAVNAFLANQEISDGHVIDYSRPRIIPRDSVSLAPNSLVAYYPLDVDTYDYSGHAFHGINSGAKQVTGKEGGAYNFDGVNDLITINNFNTDYDNVTVSAWVKPASYSSKIAMWNEIFDTWNPSGELPFRLGFENSYGAGTLSWLYANPGEYINLLNNNIPLNTWTHVAAVRNNIDGTYISSLYVNGNLVNSTSSIALPVKYAYQEAAIGSRTFVGDDENNQGSDERFDGSIDELAIWNRALTNDEVSDLYTRGVSSFTGVSVATPPAI